MNLLTYWFNPGVYKNTLRRFRWGSVLYAVILFFSVPFTFITNEPAEMVKGFYNIDGTIKCALLQTERFILPLLLAIAVPTVVALLVFNYAHSPKHGIFVHSLPVTRTQNYFSTLLAAFTLMFVPVILNGIILLILNFCGYGPILGVMNIFKWIMINFFILFIMFSVSTAASFITGNAFAAAALNIIIHLLPIALNIAIALISDMFLYGYSTDSAWHIASYAPLVWIFGNFNDSFIQGIFSMGITYGYIVMAIVFYAIGFVLYKLRKIENCGDVIAFAVAKPIVKYTLTTTTLISVISIRGIGLGTWKVAFEAAAVICAIVYFACEMLMNKTLKVWGKYKGFVGFAVSIALIISFCAFTSVFGYETYVPKAENIEKVSIEINDVNIKPSSASPEAILWVTQLHKNLLEKRPVIADKSGYTFNISYTLKNGKKVNREYLVSQDVQEQAKEKMFEYEDYKMAYTGLDKLNVEQAGPIFIDVSGPKIDQTLALNEKDATLFFEALKEDIKQISYNDYFRNETIYFWVDFLVSPNGVLVHGQPDDYSVRYYYSRININSSYKNTMAFLEEKGYYDEAISEIAQYMYITKNTVAKAETLEEEQSYKEMYANYMIGRDEVSKIDSLEDAKTLIDEHIKDKEHSFVSGETYLVFVAAEGWGGRKPADNIIEFTPETLPEYLRKYVD